MTNLIDNLDEKERYSYIYEGNSQTLDHMLVSPSLSKTSVLDIVHMNADFSAADGRVSDHDPLVAQIDLPRKTEEPPTDGGRAEMTMTMTMRISRITLETPTLGIAVAVT